MDYSVNLYDPVYLVLGVPATLTMPGTDGAVLELTVIDKASGVVTGGSDDRRRGFQSDVPSIEPAAAVRAGDLADIDLADIRGATLLMNGVTWKVRNHQASPCPNGEAAGEVYLILSELG